MVIFDYTVEHNRRRMIQFHGLLHGKPSLRPAKLMEFAALIVSVAMFPVSDGIARVFQATR